MYSVVYPESDFGRFPGMVPESNFGGFSEMVPEWFRKRSILRSWDVPQIFAYLLLPTFSCFELPFSRENTDKLLIFNYLSAEGKSI